MESKIPQTMAERVLAHAGRATLVMLGELRVLPFFSVLAQRGAQTWVVLFDPFVIADEKVERRPGCPWFERIEHGEVVETLGEGFVVPVGEPDPNAWTFTFGDGSRLAL